MAGVDMEGNMHFTVPRDYNDCLKPEETAMHWRIWAKRVDWAGRLGTVIVMVWGMAVSAYSLWLSWGREGNALDFVLSLAKWGICAGVLLCAFYILSLLFRSLASLLEHVGAMSRLMVFQSSVDGYPDSRIEGNYQWKCDCCGAVNTQRN